MQGVKGKQTWCVPVPQVPLVCVKINYERQKATPNRELPPTGKERHQHGAQIRQSGRQTEVWFMMITNTLLGLIVSPTFVPLSSPVPTRTPVVQALDPFLNPVFANPDVMSAGPVVAHIQYGALATGLLVITAH